jgi:hypothetical protein
MRRRRSSVPLSVANAPINARFFPLNTSRANDYFIEQRLITIVTSVIISRNIIILLHARYSRKKTLFNISNNNPRISTPLISLSTIHLGVCVVYKE